MWIDSVYPFSSLEFKNKIDDFIAKNPDPWNRERVRGNIFCWWRIYF